MTRNGVRFRKPSKPDHPPGGAGLPDRGHNSLADAAAHAGDHDPSRHGCAAYSQGPARAAGG